MLSKEIFANPPNAYRPIPFWFWNSKIRKDQIEAQIRGFAKKGLGGFFIHARVGLETEYLSREWIDCIRHAVDIASDLGLEVWLYDENGFPSGIGDLKVSKVREYRSKFIDLTQTEAQAGERLELQLPHGEVVLAYAQRQGEQRVDLAAAISGDRLIWTAPTGKWTVAVYSKCILEDPNDIVFGVNYMNAEAMRYFFDIALEPYDAALGEHFGKTIKGVFTDEPTLLPWHHNGNWFGERQHGRVIAWDDGLCALMKELTGLTLEQFLPHVFFDVDASTPDVRRHFWSAVSNLYTQSFFEPYRNWCHERNLKFTGHVLFEEGLYINTQFQADIAASLSLLDIPGTDHLGLSTESAYGGWSNLPKQLTNVQGEKLATSIAHLFNKEAAISETYGCAGWSLNLEKMKSIADWQYSLGVSMLCPHAMFYSIEGFRKLDAPPSENHSPSWRHYRLFSDYIGRLSYLLRSGRHVAKIALFYPVRQFWGLYAAGLEGRDDRSLSDSFDICASVLLKLHWDYDIITEQSLALADVSDGHIRIGTEEYSAIIAPPFSVGDQAFELLQDFVRNGGTWILPAMMQGETQQEQIERELALIRSSIDDNAASRLISLVSAEWTHRPKYVSLRKDGPGNVLAILAGTADPTAMVEALSGALNEAMKADVEITSEDGTPAMDIRYVHRVVDENHVYFLANISDQPQSVLISLEEKGAVEIWNPENGETYPYSGAVLCEGRLHIRYEFAPYASAVFVIDPNKPVQSRPRVEVKRREILVLPDEWTFEAADNNALRLDTWTMTMKPGASGTQYVYSSSFQCQHCPSKLYLLLDDIEFRKALMGRMDITININNASWHQPDFEWYIDPGFKTLDIASAVQLGKNSVELIIQHSAWAGQPHIITSPPMLIGRFSLDDESSSLLKPIEAVMSGSWTDFGYPFYSGTAVYSHSFRLHNGISGNNRLILSIDNVRDIVEIVVNGTTAAVRAWRPWEADITNMVKDGINVLSLRITNSAANFIGGSCECSGLLGRARIFVESIG